MHRFFALIALCVVLAGTGVAPDDASFTVVTFNIRYANDHDGVNAWSVRKGKVIEEIERLAPDVLGVQEALAPQLDVLMETLEGYAYVGVGRDDGDRAGEFAPILYRVGRYEAVESGTFWLSGTPEVPGSMSFGNTLPRICTWAVLRDTASSREIVFANVHLDHRSQPSRELGVALVLERLAPLAERPIVFMGDFNAGIGSPEIDAVSADARYGFVNAAREAGEPGETDATYTGFRGRDTWIDAPAIDHVFVTRKTLDVREASVERRVFGDGLYASDHFPVRAVLGFR